MAEIVDIEMALGQHEGETLAGATMLEQIRHLEGSAPNLGRFILREGFGTVGANLTTGYRDWALLTIAILAAIGDAGDQLGVYTDAALLNGATDDEITDVLNLACLYAGAPRAVNAARVLAERLGKLRAERLPHTVERIVGLGDHDTTVWDSGGEGVPMLLIHALSMDLRFWRKVYPILAKSGRVIAYDIRGHGRARGAPPTQSLDHVAGDALALLDILGIDQVDVYGASYGGAIAQHIILNAPTRVRSLALLATGSKAPFDMRSERATHAEAAGMEAQVAESIIRWFLPATIAVDAWEIRYARNCVRRARVEDWAASWRAMARLDVLERVADLDQPVLSLSGKQDLSAHPEDMQRTAEAYRNGEFRSVDPGTHMMPMEQPEPVARELAAFRARVEARTDRR
jgi:3-oxoadipate enol-lactonase